jgi:hypothetical protein
MSYLNTKNYAFHVPFYMFDLDNKQLITTNWVPSDISDQKSIVLTETPIPGLNYQPVSYGGGGNRKIGFTLPLVKKNNTVGNVLLLKQFDNLRNQAVGLTGMFSGQFKPNPRVLFNYGIGSVPLIYYVSKCDASSKQGWVNQFGMPMYSEITIELILDEKESIYKAEEVFRKFASLAGMVQGVFDVANSLNNRRPY